MCWHKLVEHYLIVGLEPVFPYIYICIFWVNYNDLTATSLESWLVREIIPKWALIQVGELL